MRGRRRRRVAAALARRLAFIDRARHRRLPLDPRRGRRAARRARRRLRRGGQRALRRRRGARVLPRAARAAARARGRRAPASRCDTVVERRRAARGAERRGAASAAAVVLGAAPEGEIEVRENGLRFGVDLLRGQKGGLFLDQRDNRALVRTLAGRPPRAEPVRLHGRVLDLRGGRRRARDRHRRRGGAGDRGGPPQLRAQRAGDWTTPASSRATRSRSSSGRPRRRALRPGDLRPAQLRAQPPRADRRAARLPAPASPVRRGHRAGRDAVRGVVLEPRRPRRVPRHRARRRARRRPPVRAASRCAAPPPTTRWCRNFRRATT